MARFKWLGLRNPEDKPQPATVSIGGLLEKDYVPKRPDNQSQAQATTRPPDYQQMTKPSGYDPSLDDEMSYPINPKDRPKPPQK